MLINITVSNLYTKNNYAEVIILKRRTFLKLSAFTASAAALGLGVTGCNKPTSKTEPVDEFPVYNGNPNSLVEATVDRKTGEVTPNENVMIRHSVCMSCYNNCGNRVKIDKTTNKVIGVTGNPFHPVCAEPALDYNTTVEESYKAFSLHNDQGLANRATVCAVGNSGFEIIEDPLRITVPLKRAGERGSGKWRPISWEQLMEETVEGGQIFKELGDDTVVEGFRQVFDHETLINPDAPEMGPKSNGLVWMYGGSYGRREFTMRFVNGSFGSPNVYVHSGT